MLIKNICCIGAGYVGGPTMAVIALKCPQIKITVVDSDSEKIKAWNGELNNLPVFEPGLSEIVQKVRNKNLFFSSDIDTGIDEAEMIFMAVNTPTKTEGEGAGMAANLKHIESCALNIAKVSKNDKIIIEKSTLPVRTAEKIKQILDSEGNGFHFEILSNPEFLAEGTAIQDLFKSDRVLIGGENSESGKKAVKALVDIYLNWIPKKKILTTNVWSSELSKLASNAMLAQRISSINSLSALCEKTGADIDEVSKAIGMDHRIGPKFLKASVAFGGSCFQKDILNLVYLCQYYGLNEVAEYWYNVIKINDYQKHRFAYKIFKAFELNPNGNGVSILGWSFKKNTNDTRESPAIFVTNFLIEKGIKVHIYDPMIERSRIILDLKTLWTKTGISSERIDYNLNKIFICKSISKAIKKTEIVAVLTEWDEFKNFDFGNYNKSIFDGRNIIPKNHTNYSIGK